MADSESDSGEDFLFKRRRIDPYNFSDEEEENDESSASNTMEYENGTFNMSNKSNPVDSKLSKRYGIGAKLLSKMG